MANNSHGYDRRRRRPGRQHAEPLVREQATSRLSEEASLRGRVQALKRVELAKRRTIQELSERVDSLHHTVDELLDEIESYSVEAEETKHHTQARGYDHQWRDIGRSQRHRRPRDLQQSTEFKSSSRASAIQAAHDLEATTAQVAAIRAELHQLQNETTTTRATLEQLRVEKNTYEWECAVQKSTLEQLQNQIQVARGTLASLSDAVPPPPPSQHQAPMQQLQNLIDGLSIGPCAYLGTVERQVNEGLATRLAEL